MTSKVSIVLLDGTKTLCLDSFGTVQLAVQAVPKVFISFLHESD